MNTRRYRLDRIIANLEATFDADRLALAAAEQAAARAERTAQGIAAIEPAELAAQFAECPWRAWAALASLTERQLLVEAIDYATFLAAQGVDKSWGAILRCWQRKLSERAAEAEALLALAEAGAFDRDLLAEDLAREADVEPEAQAAPLFTVRVESETQPGVFYEVATNGSNCTCWGHRRWGHCKHADAQEARYYGADHYDRRAA